MINAKKVKERIENRLKKEEKYEEINGRNCFRTKDGGYVRLDTIGGQYNCVVIEYAENRRDAENNVFEDGDLLIAEEIDEAEMVKKIKGELRK